MFELMDEHCTKDPQVSTAEHDKTKSDTTEHHDTGHDNSGHHTTEHHDTGHDNAAEEN